MCLTSWKIMCIEKQNKNVYIMYNFIYCLTINTNLRIKSNGMTAFLNGFYYLNLIRNYVMYALYYITSPDPIQWTIFLKKIFFFS